MFDLFDHRPSLHNDERHQQGDCCQRHYRHHEHRDADYFFAQSIISRSTSPVAGGHRVNFLSSFTIGAITLVSMRLPIRSLLQLIHRLSATSIIGLNSARNAVASSKSKSGPPPTACKCSSRRSSQARRGLRWRKGYAGRLFCLVDVRFAAHNGLKSDIAPCPKGAKGRHPRLELGRIAKPDD
jgi:hypothetical protein